MNLTYMLRRLFYLVLAVLGTVTLVFLALRLAPGDPVDVVLGDLRGSVSREVVESIRQQFGFDKPVHVQYLTFLARLVRGDLGQSVASGQPVGSVLIPHVTPTLMLAAAGLVVAAGLGVPTGLVAAVKRNSLSDFTLMTLAVVALSAPSFLFALFLIYYLGYRVPLFPMFGGGDPSSLSSLLHALVLPAVALGARSAALLARVTRSSTLEILRQEYVRTAHAKGLAAGRVILRHVLPNVAIPIVTIIGLDLAYLIGGTVIVETVFARPGLGKTMVDAIASRDYPVVQGAIILFAGGVILINLLTDLMYAVVDPRVRYD